MHFSSQPFFEKKDTPPFNELILSWNGTRPKKGKWTFWVSLQSTEWLQYAEWGPDHQRSFQSASHFAQVDRDVVVATQGCCTHFKVKVEGEDLSTLHRLNVSTAHKAETSIVMPQNLPNVLLKNVPRQSQFTLDHPRHKDLCSPTATSTALNCLLGSQVIDPIAFANSSYDAGADIYGNWVLNVAEAYNRSKISCHVDRLADFTALHAYLVRERPVVVSVQGTIPGAPKTYSAGHLICVIGFDGKKVLCIDSGFPANESTFIGYELAAFLKAWGARRNLAYVF